MAPELIASVKAALDALGDSVREQFPQRGMSPVCSPLFKPWNLYVIADREKVMVFITPLSGGVAGLQFVDQPVPVLPIGLVSQQLQMSLGQHPTFAASIPRGQLSKTKELAETVKQIASDHLEAVERANRLGRVGDLTGLQHLEPGLRTFLDDYPRFDRNVFIMMRFLKSDQFSEIHEAIVRSLQTRGYHGIRADDRDYTGELWTNVEVCMMGCSMGIAVFEDIEQRDFNPNVSLELGYMLGRRRRCLLLKERRLPDLPTDVIHRLYKPFDVFNIAETVDAQIAQWIEVDLRSH